MSKPLQIETYECGHTDVGDERCEKCCEHLDTEDMHCLDCGADRTEHMMAEAYDRAKDFRKYGE